MAQTREYSEVTASKAELSLPDLGVSQHHAFLLSGIWAFPAFLSFLVILSAARGLSAMHITPGLGHPDFGSTCSLVRVSIGASDLLFPFRPLPGL